MSWEPLGSGEGVELRDFQHNPDEEPTTAELVKLIDIQRLFDTPEDYYGFVMSSEELADIATMHNTFMRAVFDNRTGVEQ